MRLPRGAKFAPAVKHEDDLAGESIAPERQVAECIAAPYPDGVAAKEFFRPRVDQEIADIQVNRNIDINDGSAPPQQNGYPLQATLEPVKNVHEHPRRTPPRTTGRPLRAGEGCSPGCGSCAGATARAK